MIKLRTYIKTIFDGMKAVAKWEKKFLFTFTYYIPAPPKRDQGYQEKEFDTIVAFISKQGLKIKHIDIGPHFSNNQGGIWAICHLEGTQAQMKKINLWQQEKLLVKNSEELSNYVDETNAKSENEVELPNYHDQNLYQDKIKGLYHIK